MPAGRRVAASVVVVVAVVGTVLTTGGCSNRESAVQKRPHTGSQTASSVGGVQQITLDAGSDLRFHPSQLTVRPGRVRVVLHNTEKAGQGAPHNFDVLDVTGARTPDAQAGQTTTVTFTAPKPGRYEFVCTFHAKLGQTGTLVVAG